MKSVALVLAHSSQDDVNAPVSPRDSRSPLHLAASLGSLAIAQLLIWVSLDFDDTLIEDITNLHGKQKCTVSKNLHDFAHCFRGRIVQIFWLIALLCIFL